MRIKIWPCVCVLVESYLFLVCAWKLTWFLWWCLKLTWSHCGAPNLTWFQCRSEINLVVVGVVEIDLLLVCWPNTTCFYDEHENILSFCMGDRNWFDSSVGGQIWLDFSVGIRIDLVLGSKMTWFRVWIKINLVFMSEGVPNWLVFRVGIENNLTSVMRSK